MNTPSGKNLPVRYGVAEWYGYSFAHLEPTQIRSLSTVTHASQPCPFKGGQCRKKGGVCSLRLYQAPENDTVGATPVEEALVTVCPERFKEDGILSRWIGEVVLGTDSPQIVGEVQFLQGQASENETEGEAVGRIDQILLRAGTYPLIWCAVELQAVYFSGKGMPSQIELFRSWQGPGTPFPDEIRRPDYRSSGPKRLMPQLQTKVPTLRRWGKKMAVVTDCKFFENMGKMQTVPDVSNCDIVWFVADFERVGERYKLKTGQTYFITLERAIEGLIAGEPVSLTEFERRVNEKLNAPPKKGRAQ